MIRCGRCGADLSDIEDMVALNDYADTIICMSCNQREKAGLMTQTETHPCKECGMEITAVSPWCRACYFSGASFRADPDLNELWAAFENLSALQYSIDHTGGGCWGISLRRRDAEYPWVFLTLAYEDGGELIGDAGIPETPEGPWTCGLYSSENDFYEGIEASRFEYATSLNALIVWLREAFGLSEVIIEEIPIPTDHEEEFRFRQLRRQAETD